MFLENEWSRLVIPQRREQENEHDDDADGTRRHGQPRQ
jgi:hypothetical protein